MKDRWVNCLKSLGFVVLLTGVYTLAFATEAPYTLIDDQAKLPILTPALAKRETLKIRLKNGLEAYLISDPLAQKSGAALSVKVGSWEDPKEYPGIAHFLEHLLFLGTKKYPIESEYGQFVNENGGMLNAFTTNNNTSYLFTVDNQAFFPTLDRFSQFFKDPLFNPSGVDRELKAIDQEYAKNLENDDFRQLFVHKQLSNPNHPNFAFSMGNSESLKKVSREVLIDWYHKHYSANLMKLVAYSSEPLEKMLSHVVEDFSEIPNSQKEIFSTTLPSFSSENREKMIYVEPYKNLRSVALIWEMPAKFAEFLESKPSDLVCFVLGHEGKESLLAQLKREKLAEGLRCGGVKSGEKLFEFYLEIDLTKEGLHEVNTVIQRTFQAIANLREKGIPPYLFQELQKTESIDYQYQVREEEFTDLMKQIRLIVEEPLESFPEKSQIISTYDAPLLQEFLEALTPARCEIQVIASAAESGVTSDQKEKWLGSSFAIKPIPQEVLQGWKKAVPHPAIDLPAPNPFVPEHLTLKHPLMDKPEEGYLPEPSKIVDDAHGLVYFAPDYRYREPKIYWSFQLRTPQVVADDASKLVMADLYIKGVTEELNQLSYTAKLGGLNYAIDQGTNGIAIALDGYNENALVLFEKILDALKNEEIDKKNFSIYKDALIRKYQNFSQEMPIRQASEFLREILYKKFSSQKQKAEAIQNVTYDQFKAYRAQLFQQIFVEGLLYGNMTKEEAEQCAALVRKQFPAESYPKKEWPQVEVVVLNRNQGPFYMERQTQSQGNAVILAIEGEPFSFKNRASQQIVMQAMKEPFFSTLRTKQQTGYLIFSGAEEMKQHLFNLFAVQSNTHNSRDLLARFELFIEEFLQEMPRSQLREEQFLAIKAALLATVQEPPKNLVEMGKVLQLIAFEYDADFKWIDKRIEALKALTYAECLDYAIEVLGKQNKARLGILLKGTQSDGSILDYDKISSVEDFKKNNIYTPFKM